MRLLPEDPVKRGRVQLVLVIVVFILPLVASLAAHLFGWSTGKTGNYGTLIAPRALPAAPLVALDGGPDRLDALQGKWLLLQFDAAACDAGCERKLYVMRQARLALGRDQDRVARVWIVEGAGRPSARLLAAIEGTRLLRAPDARLAASFPAARSLRDHIYVVDPRGNLMLRFPREADPAKVIKDLQQLLKYSAIG